MTNTTKLTKLKSRFASEKLLALFRRWLRFNAVGAFGVAVQLGLLIYLTGPGGMDYLLATAIAVEASVLHNFFWHERWTWRDRTRHDPQGLPVRLLQFNATAGGLSLVGNLALMRLLVGELGLPVLTANLLAISILSVANFFVSHLLIFQSFRDPLAGSPENPPGVLGDDSLLSAAVTLPCRRS